MKNYAKMKALPLGSIRPKSFIYEQLVRNKNGMGGHLPEIEPEMIAAPYLRDFNVEKWADDTAVGWGAEISGNYYTGLVQLAFTLGDEELIAKATEWVNEVLKRQQPDGYIGVYSSHSDLIYQDFNGWGTSRGLRALLFFYEATGREDVLEAVYRCLLWFTEKWSGDKKTTYCGAMICEPMLYVYKVNGDKRLLDFAVDYAEYLCKETVFYNSYKDYAEEKFRYFSNHTANYAPMISLLPLLYDVTGDEKYLNAAETGFKKIREKGMHLNGGAISVAEYVGPVSASYETEYCCFAVYNYSYMIMAGSSGLAKYGDYIEQTLYNGAQGARKKDEKAIAYMSAPNQIFATNESSITLADYQTYSPCHWVSCCPVNSVSVVPEFLRGMSMTNGNDLYLLTYGPAKINYGGWSIDNDTLYPFRNDIKLTVKKEVDGDLYLRIPIWNKGYTLKINGQEEKTITNENGFIKLSLKEGESVVELSFNAELEIITVDDSDVSAKYPLAFKYGALLFSYPIKEKWVPYLPKDWEEDEVKKNWPWFNVYPGTYHGGEYYPEIHKNMILRRNNFNWNVAVDEDIKVSDIKIEFLEPNGYPWENPWVKLIVPGYHVPLGSAPYMPRTMEPFGKRLEVDKKITMELVPYGNTNLRITYFPKADV